MPPLSPEAGPPVAVVPTDAEIEAAVVRAGGSLVAPGVAGAIVWTDPRDPEALRRVLAESPARWIQLPFAGIERFHAAGVLDPNRTWTCAKGVYGPASAEHALALLLLAARALHRHVRARRWLRAGDGRPARRLADGTVLIVGTGGIGRSLAMMLAPLGPRIIAVNRSGRPMDGAERTVALADLGEVLPQADWVVIAAPLTAETRGIFDARAFQSMKRDAWIVNVARGGLVDTDALVAALRDGKIGGAALDVSDPEPLPEGHPLWSMDDVVVTSHTANTWRMALPALAALVERNVRRFARGEPLEGLVDVEAGY